LARKLESGMNKTSGDWGYNCPAMGNDTDNSNTHFALLALWVSRSHEPCKGFAEACIRRAAQHFRDTQDRGTGGWSYSEGSLFVGRTNLSMTSVGLLALGMEHALRHYE